VTGRHPHRGGGLVVALAFSLVPRSAARPLRVKGSVVALCIAAAVAALSGCGAAASAEASTADIPSCEITGPTASGQLLLMAQSVPTAQFIPCFRGLPAGWRLAESEFSDTGSTLVLNSDREGTNALVVRLQRRCDVSNSTEVRSDYESMRRYEQVLRITQGYAGLRSYVFPGGCVTYEINLRGQSRAEPLAEIALALGFISRSELAQHVHDRSNGRLELDPAPDA
jgi:hypothetical protein